jgi:ATP-dependent DNA ligase
MYATLRPSQLDGQPLHYPNGGEAARDSVPFLSETPHSSNHGVSGGGEGAEGAQWIWAIKLDGYRAIAVRSGTTVALFSRNKKSLSKKFPYIVEALAGLPEGTVVDGELVALDDRGRPDFNLLQNVRGAASRIHYYIFDLLCCGGRDLTSLPLVERRALLKSLVTIRDTRIRVADYIEAGADEVLAAVREQELEGIVGKRRDSIYEPGKRSGAWIKHRVNLGQEIVIGGYFPGPHGIDSLISVTTTGIG